MVLVHCQYNWVSCRSLLLPQKLNEQAASMFELGEEPDVTTGLGVMNELVVPCIPLLLAHDAERDLLAVEDMRNRWCSYLGQEMEGESAMLGMSLCPPLTLSRPGLGSEPFLWPPLLSVRPAHRLPVQEELKVIDSLRNNRS